MGLKWAVAAMIGILLIVLCIWLTAVFIKWLSSLDWTFESASKRAGRYGEEIAAEMISRVLREGDYLLTNIEITYDGSMSCARMRSVMRSWWRRICLLSWRADRRIVCEWSTRIIQCRILAVMMIICRSVQRNCISTCWSILNRGKKCD